MLWEGEHLSCDGMSLVVVAEDDCECDDGFDDNLLGSLAVPQGLSYSV